MLSINTNLSSLIVQSNLKTSTLGLNQAIERMTTGFKINGAKDNAAGYSIAKNMDVKLSSYDVALDNATMGLDLIMTASDSLNVITAHLQRMRNLVEQAANGTYGKDSLQAIQSEIDARAAEIARISSNTEYNGIKLLEKSDKFVTTVEKLTEEEAIAQGYTIIKTAEELQNIGLSGKYILMNDIDLAGIEWQTIGAGSNTFNGELNGNGYVIKNLSINRANDNNQGLFGVAGSSSIIKNVGLENVNVTGKTLVGGIVGTTSGDIINCYAEGNISGYSHMGLLAGQSNGNITDSCAFGEASGALYIGGLVGWGGDITSSYTFCDVKGSNKYVGGLAGFNERDISNSYSLSNVLGGTNAWGIGGLTGRIRGNIINSFADCTVTGDEAVGGLLGYVSDNTNVSIINSYALGNTSGNTSVGGLVGETYYKINFTESCFNTEAAGAIAGVGRGSYDGEPKGVTMTEINKLIADGVLPTFSAAQNAGTGLEITMQVGINSGEDSKISFNIDYTIGRIDINVLTSANAKRALVSLDNYLKQISELQTDLGANQNRLESAIESLGISIENLTSSQSTIRDADIAKESSEYIKMQILQQASATLLATANQTPSIALQLL